MAFLVFYDLDVLASNPTEINQIAERLKQPSAELVNWRAEESRQPLSEIAANLKKLVEFEAIHGPGHIDDSLNKARSFRNVLLHEKWMGIVDSHLFEVSEAFPSAIFMLDWGVPESDFGGQIVIRAGEEVQHVCHGDTQCPLSGLDIFAPYRDEYLHGLEFGSLWKEWLEEEIATQRELSLRRDPEADEEDEEFEWQWWHYPE
jgi:hypothetical protein